MATKPVTTITTAAPAEADTVMGVKGSTVRLFSILEINNLVGVNIKRFYQNTDGSDWLPALNRALAVSPHVEFPAGSYNFSGPADYIQGMQLTGPKEVKTSAVGGARITANNGFIKNDNTTRKQITIKNLLIQGNRTTGSVGIDGPFGGTIEGCKIIGFDHLIRNASGYLVQYIRNSFANGAFGINTADANGTVIENNHFNNDVAVQISTRDVTPQSGTNSGLPLIIRENNFNLTDATTVALRVRGQLDIRGNYFEKFSGSTLNTMVDIEVNRFDHQGLIFESNELNGQSSNCRAIYLNGSHLNLDNWTEGRITCNRFLGMATYIEYGPNNRIPGLKIYGNSRTSGDFNVPVINSYRNQHVPTLDGWTYLRLDSDFSNSTTTMADVTGLAFTPDPDAQYIVEGLFMLQSAAATTGPQTGFVWPTNVGNGVYYTQQASAAGSTVPRYGNTSANFTSGVADIADATGSWPQFINLTFLTTSTTTGDFKVTLRSEVAASNVTMKTGSYIRYRRLI